MFCILKVPRLQRSTSCSWALCLYSTVLACSCCTLSFYHCIWGEIRLFIFTTIIIVGIFHTIFYHYLSYYTTILCVLILSRETERISQLYYYCKHDFYMILLPSGCPTTLPAHFTQYIFIQTNKYVFLILYTDSPKNLLHEKNLAFI